MKRMKIYLSVPITGRPIETVRHDADLTAAMLRKQGHEVVNPLDIYAGPEPTWKDHMAYDIRALLDCDAIYMMPGWGMSCGCCIEMDVVREVNHHADRYGWRKIGIIYGKA